MRPPARRRRRGSFVGTGQQQRSPPLPGTMSIVVPEVSCSMLSESMGLQAGLALASAMLGHPTGFRVLGDNLPVLRLAAANGRVRTPGVWEVLEVPLLHVAMQSWDCSWVAVRRHLNAVADALATRGTHKAVDQAAMQQWAPTIEIWCQDNLAVAAAEILWHPGWEVSSAPSPLSPVL